MIAVLDDTRATAMPTGRVILHLDGSDINADDKALATAAGYSSRHFGYSVRKGTDDTGRTTAVVSLWND